MTVQFTHELVAEVTVLQNYRQHEICALKCNHALVIVSKLTLHYPDTSKLKWSERSLYCSCWWGETVSLNCGHNRAYCPWHEYRQLWSKGTDRRKLKNSEKNLVPVLLCPPQISHGLTQAQTRVSAVRGWQLTCWAMAQPSLCWVISQQSTVEFTFNLSSFIPFHLFKVPFLWCQPHHLSAAYLLVKLYVHINCHPAKH
jgi:hypothetical protein